MISFFARGHAAQSPESATQIETTLEPFPGSATRRCAIQARRTARAISHSQDQDYPTPQRRRTLNEARRSSRATLPLSDRSEQSHRAHIPLFSKEQGRQSLRSMSVHSWLVIPVARLFSRQAHESPAAKPSGNGPMGRFWSALPRKEVLAFLDNQASIIISVCLVILILAGKADKRPQLCKLRKAGVYPGPNLLCPVVGSDRATSDVTRDTSSQSKTCF